ncbi:MAG TPA: molybdopterin-dependent oxidoreductase [Alphaproteobacteria bacterium]|nr:molybdopterin-dependent oxidoreductase [Alphaproteobacteria bacterium]
MTERPVLPPNQALAAPGKWPVVGEQAPRADDAPWTVALDGLVEAPQRWSLDALRALPQTERIIDIHCVTRWSKLGARFEGVPFRLLIEAARPRPEARFVSFVARSPRAHSTSMPLADLLALDPLVAFRYEGEELAAIHGGPVRMVVPGRYFYKSLKWLERIELLAEDRLGYWEDRMGYHNRADPWAEERYVVRHLDRRTVMGLFERRDLSGQDLLGLLADGMGLEGLNARGALLRNAQFRRADLRGADFAGANLSNAHLEAADLRGANLRDADAEGADFRGADLRGADFTGASLFGASFCAEPGQPAMDARIDPSTRIEAAQLEKLSPAQQDFLRRALGLPG